MRVQPVRASFTPVQVRWAFKRSLEAITGSCSTALAEGRARHCPAGPAARVRRAWQGGCTSRGRGALGLPCRQSAWQPRQSAQPTLRAGQRARRTCAEAGGTIPGCCCRESGRSLRRPAALLGRARWLSGGHLAAGERECRKAGLAWPGLLSPAQSLLVVRSFDQGDLHSGEAPDQAETSHLPGCQAKAPCWALACSQRPHSPPLQLLAG